MLKRKLYPILLGLVLAHMSIAQLWEQSYPQRLDDKGCPECGPRMAPPIFDQSTKDALQKLADAGKPAAQSSPGAVASPAASPAAQSPASLPVATHPLKVVDPNLPIGKNLYGANTGYNYNGYGRAALPNPTPDPQPAAAKPVDQIQVPQLNFTKNTFGPILNRNAADMVQTYDSVFNNWRSTYPALDVGIPPMLRDPAQFDPYPSAAPAYSWTPPSFY